MGHGPTSIMTPVYIIDDDRDVRSSLVTLLRSLDVTSRPFAGVADFLEELEFLEPGCVLVDLRMPNESGLELLEELRERDNFWPAVMMSGHGDISLAVQAMKLGAIEFLEKPFSDDELIAALEECSRVLPASVSRSRQARARRKALAALSARERQVFEGVIEGKTNKQIAAELQLSPRTIESYRLTMMAKLGAQSLHDLLAIVTPEERVR